MFRTGLGPTTSSFFTLPLQVRMSDPPVYFSTGPAFTVKNFETKGITHQTLLIPDFDDV